MKKLISLTFLLLFMFSMIPTKVEAQKKDKAKITAKSYKKSILSTENHLIIACDGSGSGCSNEGIVILDK